TAAVLYHQYRSTPLQVVATKSTAHTELAPSSVPGQLLVQPVKTMIVEPGPAPQPVVKPIERHHEHITKQVPIVKPVVQKLVEQQKPAITTAVVPAVKPVATHPKAAMTTAKPKGGHADVAYLPPPEPKPAPASVKQNTDTATELKKAQLQEEIDRIDSEA